MPDEPDRAVDPLLGAAGPDTQTLRLETDAAGNTRLAPTTPATIDPGDSFRADQGPLPGYAYDLLLLADEVLPSEVEALAVTLWDDAGWVAPGRLRLTGEVHLRGPYTLSRADQTALTVPAWATCAFALEAPGQGAGPIPADLVTAHPLVQAYRTDQPWGDHWEAITGLYAMARRLAGAWRVHRSAALLQPDPDSAVSLTVYAPAWLDEGDLRALIAQAARGTTPVTPAPAARSRSRRRRDEEAAKAWTIAQLGAAEFDRIAKEARAFDEMAAAHPADPVGYSFTLQVGHRSEIGVAAQPIDTPPPALRWEPWARGSLAEFAFTWTPPVPAGRGHALNRTQRVERLRVAETVEALAAALHNLVGGAIVDEDGFLVALAGREDA